MGQAFAVLGMKLQSVTSMNILFLARKSVMKLEVLCFKNVSDGEGSVVW
jgi:hypothetical protein